ncbi:hypothetical protein E1161_13385 [Saccharopolyspora aridisoli]|uniref:DUF4355 domain-containing protein n=1 Tax=Saccharopolyspora aridisoli TaxID=2530385 RepID=A0A4R4UKR3_9PSEU|nr:hypothetical protein [Saccharopolyspora aridisoli]TDC92361.1 hypothetical protein E1161_13385 [Saccharopolyspora aridisoli]
MPESLPDPANADVAPEDTSTEPERESIETLPDFAQKIIRSLRSEAATHRHKARVASEKAAALEQETAALHAAKTHAEATLAESRMDLTRIRAALSAGVPAEVVEDFAARLHGSNAEEIAADAARLKSTFGVSARRGDPSQGSSGGSAMTDHPLTNFFLSHRT